MRRPWILSALCSSAMLLSCSASDNVSSTSIPEIPADDAFEIEALRAGMVRVRSIDVPAGYTLVDVNDRGDLLLGSAWLPRGKRKPLALPFTGRSINNRGQILGPGLSIYEAGRVTNLPDPCIPFTNQMGTVVDEVTTLQDVTWDCRGQPVQLGALAQNGDGFVSFRQDGYLAGGGHSGLSSYGIFAVWRAGTASWQVIFRDWCDGISYEAAISDGGLIALSEGGATCFSPRTVGFDDSDACPASEFALVRLHPRAVNDSGDVVGSGICYLTETGLLEVGAKWPGGRSAVSLNGLPSLIDNIGNAAGIRTSDSHAIIWLKNGTEVDLSAAVGNQPASVKKFLKPGQVFGFVGVQPVIWQFGL